MSAIIFKRTIIGLGVIALLFCVSSCAVNPVTGKSELMLVSESDEAQLGLETDSQVMKEYGVYKDTALTAYLNQIYQKLGKLSHRPQLDYHFKIIDASVVNAFAAPGGYVYFSRGILAYLNSEAEVAGVMGHEIGHIAARHSAKQYSRAQLTQVGLGIGGALVDSPILSQVAQEGAGLLFLRFSRDNEREADNLGVEYAMKGGYDGAQLANFFDSLERMNPGEDRSGIPGWFTTHPSPEDRVQAVRAKAKEWQQKLNMKDSKIGRDSYLRKIEGLIFGDDPHQGYVEENVFYHPDLRLQFPVPPKWKLNNTSSHVQMANEAGDALILFTLAQGTSSREAAKSFVSESKASVIQADSIRVDGFPCQRVVSEIQSENGVLGVLSYFIEKGGKVFVFHGISTSANFKKYVPDFKHTMGQFKELRDPAKINVRPDRVRIYATKTSGTLESALQSMGVTGKRLMDMALLNNAELKQVFPANTLIKVIEKGR